MNNLQQQQFFKYPMNGIIVLVIFLIVAPLVQTFIAAMLDHNWYSNVSDTVLGHIGYAVSNVFFPKIMIGYSIYMIPSFIIAVICGYRSAQGYGISPLFAVTASLIGCVGAELLIRALIFLSGVPAFTNYRDFLFLTIAQGIVVGFVCWFFISYFKLDKAPIQK